MPSHSTENVRQSPSLLHVAGPVSVADSGVVSAGASVLLESLVEESLAVESDVVESLAVESLDVESLEDESVGDESVFAESPPLDVSVPASVVDDEPSSLLPQAERETAPISARPEKRREDRIARS